MTREIELRYTPTGTAATKIGLAVNGKRKSNTGEWIDETCFVDVNVFGKAAEVASEFLRKGSPVFIEGKLRYETWEKDGIKHSKISVTCDRLQLIGPKRDQTTTNGHTANYNESFTRSHSSQGYDSNDENVPF